MLPPLGAPGRRLQLPLKHHLDARGTLSPRVHPTLKAPQAQGQGELQPTLTVQRQEP